jgi:hypothetical protein
MTPMRLSFKNIRVEVKKKQFQKLSVTVSISKASHFLIFIFHFNEASL